MSDKALVKLEKPTWLDRAFIELKPLADKFAVIQSADDLPEARDLLNAIADQKKKIVDFVKPQKDFANKTHKAITTAEKEWLSPLEELDRTVRSALGKFAEEEERKRLAAVREAEELARVVEEMGGFDDADFGPATVDLPVAPKLAVAGLSFRDERRFKIVDAAAIPRRFLIPDEKAIQALVDQLGERAVEACPGIEFYVEKVPVRR